MSSLWTREFWSDAAERAARSFAQFALAFLTTDTLFDARTWQTIGFATLFSVLMSVAGKGSGSPDSASFLPPSRPDAPRLPDSFAEIVGRRVAERVAEQARDAMAAALPAAVAEPAARAAVDGFGQVLRDFQDKVWGKR